MVSIPSTRKAVVSTPEHTAILTDLAVPTPGEGEVLVRVQYAALNPVDWKLLERGATPSGSVLVKDYAGTVVSVGPHVSGWQVGDRIAGIAMGGLGGLAGGATTYAAVEADLAWHVPASISLAEATTFGIGGTTAALLLYHHAGTPLPPAKVEGNPWLLVSGGSTSVGVFLIQWAKLSGYRVVATASERNFELVKRYGADEVVSYADKEHAVETIKKLHPAIAAELAGGTSWALSRAVGADQYLAVLEDPEEKAVHVHYGRAFKPNAIYRQQVRNWAAAFYTRLPGYITEDGIKPGPVTVRDGLEKLPEGLGELKKGVSGTKLVFRVQGEE